MAISYIGSATGTNTVTLPAHVAGDVLVAFAFRDGNNAVPSNATSNGIPWSSLLSTTGTNTCGARLAVFRARGPNTANPTFTNATSVVVHVYRGVHPLTPTGGTGYGTGTAASVTYPAIGTMTNATGTSWVAGFAGHRSVNTSLETPPSGMPSNRSTVVDATDEAAGHDTNGGVTSWAATAVAVGGTASGWCAATVELIASPYNTYSANKITNGDFPTATTGWAADPGGSGTAISVVSAKLQVVAPVSVTGPPSARQQISNNSQAVVVGDVCRFRWKADSTSSAIAAMLAYPASFSPTYVDYESTSATQAQFEEWFTATETDVIVFAATRTSSGTVRYDDIELVVATVVGSGDGSSAGLGAATATSISTNAAAGTNATGVGAATGTGTGIRGGAGASAGIGAATAVGDTAGTTVSGAGASAGTSTVQATGRVIDSLWSVSSYDIVGGGGGTYTDATHLTLGTQVFFTAAGDVTGVSFYRSDAAAGATGTVMLFLITGNTTGTLLVSKTYSGHSGTGWRTVTFDTPYTIDPAQNYTVAWKQDAASSTTYYAADNNFFTTVGWTSPGGYIFAPKDNEAAYHGHTWRQSVFGTSSSANDIPYLTFGSTAYFVDPIFEPATGSTGSAAGTSTVQATSASTNAAAGTSAGLGAATATAISTFAAVAASAGLAVALAVGAIGGTVETGAGSSTGASTVQGTGRAIVSVAPSSAGSSTAQAGGASTYAGAGNAPGVATATATGRAIIPASASSAGTSTALAVGDVASATESRAGSSAGTSSALATGASTAAVTGSATGTSGVTATAILTSASAGSAAGTASATAASITTAGRAGSAAGTSSAIAVGTLSSGPLAFIGAASGTSTAQAIPAYTVAVAGSAGGTSFALGVPREVATSGQSSSATDGTTEYNNPPLRTGRVPPMPPPRMTGDPTDDMSALREWMNQIYRSLIDSGLGDPTYQFGAFEIDPANPPDPNLTTIGRAQATANLALAQTVQKRWGNFTISEIDLAITVTFGTPFANDDYFIVATLTSASSSAAAGARIINAITKTESGFTATLNAVPGLGESVTFDYLAGA